MVDVRGAQETGQIAMMEGSQSCSVCGEKLVPQLGQAQLSETRRSVASFGAEPAFCSQLCRHRAALDQACRCSSCAAEFVPQFAYQVGRVRGVTVYSCSEICRQKANSVRSVPQPIAFAARSAQQAGPLESTTPGSRARASVHAPHTLAVFNHKGGTGKTTTSVSVAAGLAEAGKKVLLIDTDSQGNVAVSLGLKPARTLYHCLVLGMGVDQVVAPARQNLDVVASNHTLAAAELYLVGKQRREHVLASRMQRSVSRYDFVIIDCSPSLSLLNQNALVLADSLLCPVACDYLSLVGVQQVLKTLENINRTSGSTTQLWGVLPTMFDPRANICHSALETLQTQFGDRCLPPIRSATRVKEAPAQGQTLFEYAGKSRAATEYSVIVDRLLSPGEWVAQSA